MQMEEVFFKVFKIFLPSVLYSIQCNSSEI